MDVIFFDTPFGRIGVASERGDAVSRLYFPDDAVPEAQMRETFFLTRAKHQLLEYFSGNRTIFTLPLRPKGTAFQKEVWKKLLDIPYGETRSYREIAIAIGKPGAAKAVGGACRRNPIPILIPCHRVVGTNGGLTGFSGGLDLKEKLLNLEQNKGAMVCRNCFIPANVILKPWTSPIWPH